MATHKERTGKTRVGKFLQGVKGVAPALLDLASNVPGLSALGDIGDMIKGDPKISESDKETALGLLELDKQEMMEVTKRWEADMKSDSWMSKNVRPMSLIFLLVSTVTMLFIDSMEKVPFTLKPEHTILLQTLLVTVIVAYFGSRGMEKYKKIRKG